MADEPGGELARLESWLADLRHGLSDAEVRALSKRVAQSLRAANAKRIKANLTPEGRPMVPRKIERRKKLRDELTRARRSVRQKLMFQRAIKPGYLRWFTPTGEANVGFVGAMARIMRVHHDGLEDHVTRDPSSPKVKYPARPVIGMTEADREAVLAMLEEHFGR